MQLSCVHLLALMVGVTLCAPIATVAADGDGLAIMRKARMAQRRVGSVREELDIFVVSKPQVERFSVAQLEAFARHLPAGVVHKRAASHVQLADDNRDKARIRFSLPPEDAGTAFLFLRQPAAAQDDQWVFLPGMPAVRRVSAGSTQAFMGTTLIYEDIRSLVGERLERFTYEHSGSDSLDGQVCDIIIARPNLNTASAYARRTIWIARDTSVSVLIEAFDGEDRRRKLIRSSAVREVMPGVHRADLIEARDTVLDEATVIWIVEREADVTIAPRVFTRDDLMRAVGD